MFSTLAGHTLCLRKLSFTGCITHIPLLSGYQWGPATGGHRQQSDNRKIHFPHPLAIRGQVHVPVNDAKLVQELEDTREGETIILF